MKKLLGMIFLGVVVGVACFFPKEEQQKEKKEEETKKVDIEKMVTNMSLDEKIAQMLIVMFQNTEMDDSLKEAIQAKKPGGYILFSNNLTDYETTKKLISDMQSISNIPLFIGIDQEGGRVQRLQNMEGISITSIPSMEEVGKKNDEKYAYNLGKTMGKELSLFGINMDFAPTIDTLLNEKNKVIGDRSFGSDVNVVSKLGISLAKGLEEENVIAVYKHFPGHGSTEVDSHYDLPVLNKTKEELLFSDFIPFQNAISANAQVIMVGHLAVPNITKDETPASLSKELITDLLKEEMGYKGLIITDALNMKAITKNYSEKEVYEKAIHAGVDLLLMPNSLESAISFIKESIQEGVIEEEQINQSVKKILNLKYRMIKE